jgi:hypothetical protein
MTNRDYQYMKRAERLDDFTIDSGSLYLYGHDHEERSYACANFVKTKQVDIIVLELDYVDKDKMHIVGTNIPDIQLGSQKAITEFIQKWGYKRVYIDVTGMNVRIAAALLLRIERTDIEVHIVYAEPYKYHTEQFHKEGNDHEWAGIIDGIMPLPGFANFADPNEEFLFCVFLGFEGGRFTHLLKEVQPMEELIIPVFGIPGFRIEYPYNAYWSNRKGLKDSDSSANVKYASANSIVDAYMLLNRIKKENDTHKMLIAPIGTTPHTIAAIAFAIKHFNDVEIVYDNPKKVESRSEGIGLILDCNMSKLLKENP